MLGSLRKSRSRQTKIALNYHQPRGACGTFLSPMRHRQSALALSRAAQRRFEAVRGNRHFGGSSRKDRGRASSLFSFSFFPHSSSTSRFTAGEFVTFILSQSEGAPGTLGGILH